jgi:hypothetical protein
MKYLLPFIILTFLSCSSYSVHEQNMITQNKRMMLYDRNSINKQQHIRSSNKSKNSKVKKIRKIRKYIR